MNITFFPRDTKFWMYHCSLLSIFLSIQIAVSFFMEEFENLWLFHLISIIGWTFSFTIAVLLYRRLYKINNWQEEVMFLLFVKSVLLAIVLAHLMFAFYSLLSFPPFWEELLLEEQKKSPELTSQKLFLRIYFGNIFSSSFLIIAWSFIYIGITNARKAKASQLDNLRLQNSLKEAQLSSLSNQLNPHFLFNSLNNIRFMIHENAEQADNMITALSEVLRYSLESSQHEKRLLSKEVEVIQRYIEIVNIQFEDRLNFSMDIPNSLMDMSVPPMFLQMLIENAVKHGLEQMQHGGEISVSAVSRAESAEFSVVNDIPENGPSESSSTGLGLKNIQQRLSLLYAGNASIEATHVANTFQVKISLPH